MKQGVYAIIHVPTGAAYVGGSEHIVNRFTWHRHVLRRGVHTSPLFQDLWDRTQEHEWVFVVLEFCRGKKHTRDREDHWIANWPVSTLNDRLGNVGWRHSEETKRKQREGRARYLKKPGARKKLSTQAKQQHREGRFGR